MRVAGPCTWVALVVLAAGARAGEIAGTVELVGKGGKRLSAEELADVVVSFAPSVRVPVAPLAEPQVVTTRDKVFHPRVLPVTVGTTVRFPNEDAILHNAFSVSPGNAFDAGLYRKGEGHAQTFTQAGVVRVFCNVHHAMAAYVVVLDTPFFARPSAAGAFRLEGVPDGPGRLTAFHPQADPVTIDVAAPAPAVTVRLELTQRRVPPHLNKLGEPYDASSPGSYE